MKQCTRCQKLLDNQYFSKNGSRKNGLSDWCKICNKDYLLQKKGGEYIRKRKQKSPDDHSLWRHSKRGRISSRIRTGKYHAKKLGHARPEVTVDQIIEAEKQQNGLCGSCGDPFGHRGYHIDHCHETGKFRGLLCEACNLIEGLAKNPERCDAVAAYMRQHTVT